LQRLRQSQVVVKVLRPQVLPGHHAVNIKLSTGHVPFSSSLATPFFIFLKHRKGSTFSSDGMPALHHESSNTTGNASAGFLL
jgi:hypothetical protein